MKKIDQNSSFVEYTAPQLEVLDLCVEAGFAISPTSNGEDNTYEPWN